MNQSDFEQRATRYADALPGIVRATLVDFGIADEVIEHRQLGWDGDFVTVPVRTRSGRIAFFERWDAAAVGVPVEKLEHVELFGWEVVLSRPERLIVAEGIHEALVFESQGLPTVSATDTGRFFKEREWGPYLNAIPDVVLAYRRGDRGGPTRHQLSRGELRRLVCRSIPHACVLAWPKDVGSDGGAFSFFVKSGRTVEDFEQLLAGS